MVIGLHSAAIQQLMYLKNEHTYCSTLVCEVSHDLQYS